jgi:CIC family chloride channel protein
VPVAASTPLDVLLRQASASTQDVFHVIGADGKIVGLCTLDMLRAFFFDKDIGNLAIAADCAMPFVSVTPEDNLATALERFAASHYPELPVVDADNAANVIGLLSYEELLHAYNRELLARRHSAESGDSRVSK